MQFRQGPGRYLSNGSAVDLANFSFLLTFKMELVTPDEHLRHNLLYAKRFERLAYLLHKIPTPCTPAPLRCWD